MSKSSRFGAGLLGAALIPILGFACSSKTTDGGNGTGGAPGGGLGGAPATGGAVATGGSMAGGMPGSGGAFVNTGGTAPAAGGAAGSAGVGAAGAPGDGKALYVCTARGPRDPGGTGMQSAMCCGGKGTCVTPTGSESANLGHETCAPSLKCAPNDATMMAAGAFAKCNSKVVTSDPMGLEGRCIPKCFMVGNLQLPTLDNGGGTCASGEVCAPCFSPIDGKSTGACSMKTGDMPMNTTAPKPYVVCPMAIGGAAGMGGGGAAGGGAGGTTGAGGSAGGGAGGTTGAGGSAGGGAGGTTGAGGSAGAAGSAGMGGVPIPQGGGLCVPETALAPLTDAANPYYNPSIPGLKKDNCIAGEKCVPAQKVVDPGHCFDKCMASDLTVSIGGDPSYVFGACTPAYVIYDVAGSAGITVSTGGGPCPSDMLCAPCRDPLHQGEPSGSCY